MKTWFDDLRRVTLSDGRTLIGASFRGVPFFVESSERSGGRRTVAHEFPLRDEPFYEDLGRAAGTFRIEGYVLGADYIVQRDALEDALEAKSGPGTLVDPYHGTLSAICPRYSVRSSRDEGGLARFAIEFAETPAQAPQPSQVVDSAGDVSAGADAANAAMDAEFAEQYDSAGLPAFALASAETALKNAAAALQAKLGPIITATQELAEFTGQVALMTAQAASLVRSPGSVIAAFRSAFSVLEETVLAAPGAVMNGLIDAYAEGLGLPVVVTTATRARELANQAALTAALRRVLAIEAARIAPVVPYVSIEDAIEARDAVAAMLEEQAGLADDPAYPAIVDLRSQVLRAVPGATAFAQIVTVTRNVPIPSLLLAYQLYGSVDLELDIIARNGVAHPGFVAGNLRVLSDG